MDYASATPIDKTVISKMINVMKENFANPSALHDAGVKVKKILETTRKNVAEILNAHKDEIIFTSGATESNNLAILGIIEKFQGAFPIPHIVTTNIEHSSVLEVCKHLEKMKQAEITYVPVEKNGIVDPKKIKKAIKINTVLVSVMYANNEIGTIQPIQEIAKEIRHLKKGKDNSLPFFHTDATQAVNYLPIKVEKLGIDLMSFNSAKIYGPKGIGVLYVKRNTLIKKIIFGGNQEFNLRPGTENVVSVIGLAEALKITEKIKEKEVIRLTELRDYFIDKLMSKMPFGIKIGINGDFKNRLPNNINITIPKIPSDLLVVELSAKGIYVSEKSACKSGNKSGSYVRDTVSSFGKKSNSLRISLGRQTTKKDIDYVLNILSKILTKLKKWYN
ncbi:MAG: cysteine desulfurase family protein [Patescibacteria group bacterium]